MNTNYNFKNERIVYVAESMSEYNNLSLYRSDFEQELKIDTMRMLEILKKNFRTVFYYDSPEKLIDNISQHKNDIVFPNWFGKDSRNRKGFIPAICEAYKLKYVGSDTHTHILCSDKYTSKLYAQTFGLKSSSSILLDRISTNNRRRIEVLDLPIIVKPNFGGNSIGISSNSVFNSYDDAVVRANSLIRLLGEQVIIEEYLQGHEVKVFLFGNKENIQFSHQSKLVINGEDYFTNQVLGFNSKMFSKNYTNIATNIVSKTDIDAMKRIFLSFSKAEYLRIDGRVKDGVFSLLELSPDCALNEPSTFSGAFNDNGYSYDEAITALITNSLSHQKY